MSEENSIIKNIKIEKRINDGTSVFTVEFNTPLHPDEFQVGMPFELVVDTATRHEDFIVFTGIIESVDRDEKDQNRIYRITGRDEGRLLTRQPFEFSCETLATRKYSYTEILERILKDTDLEIGREIVLLQGSV